MLDPRLHRNNGYRSCVLAECLLWGYFNLYQRLALHTCMHMDTHHTASSEPQAGRQIFYQLF